MRTRPLLSLISAALVLLSGTSTAQSEQITKYGGSVSSQAGTSVAGGVDFNGDGYKDWVYGVPYADLGGKTNNGSVRIVDGQDGSILATKQGIGDGDALGTTVAIAGDVNDDGVNDIIAGAPFGLNGSGIDSGYARVYSGADFTLLHTLQGFDSGGRFGASVAGRIDPNGDGHDDLIVGAPIAGFLLAPEGKVYVFDGDTGALMVTLTGWQSSGYGWSVASAGFVNNDADRDFIVGAPGYLGGAGRVQVYDGVTYAVLHDWTDGGSFEGYGWKVEGNLNLNGDGVSDLAASAYLAGEGEVFCYDGATGAQLETFVGEASGDRYGVDISRVGDIDLDGFSDLAIGSIDDYMDIVSPAKGERILRLSGSPGDRFGEAVGLAGDIDQDGIRDFLVGGPGVDNLSGETNAGSASVYSSAPWFMNYCTAGTTASGCQASIFGSGTPSASADSGFTLFAFDAEGDKSGLFFYGANGRQTNPWGTSSSFQCVVPPVKRGALQAKAGTQGACDADFSEDLNARWCSTCPKPNHNFGVGAVVQAQFWFRDPQNTSNQTTGLSSAIEFIVAP